MIYWFDCPSYGGQDFREAGDILARKFWHMSTRGIQLLISSAVLRAVLCCTADSALRLTHAALDATLSRAALDFTI